MAECTVCGRWIPEPMKYCSTICRDKAEGTDYATVKDLPFIKPKESK